MSLVIRDSLPYHGCKYFLHPQPKSQKFTRIKIFTVCVSMLVQQSDVSNFWCDKGSPLVSVSPAQGTGTWWHSVALMPTFHGPMQVSGSHLAFEDMEKFYFLMHRREGGQDYLQTTQWQSHFLNSFHFSFLSWEIWDNNFQLRGSCEHGWVVQSNLLHHTAWAGIPAPGLLVSPGWFSSPTLVPDPLSEI